MKTNAGFNSKISLKLLERETKQKRGCDFREMKISTENKNLLRVFLPSKFNAFGKSIVAWEQFIQEEEIIFKSLIRQGWEANMNDVLDNV